MCFYKDYGLVLPLFPVLTKDFFCLILRCFSSIWPSSSTIPFGFPFSDAASTLLSGILESLDLLPCNSYPAFTIVQHHSHYVHVIQIVLLLPLHYSFLLKKYFQLNTLCCQMCVFETSFIFSVFDLFFFLYSARMLKGFRTKFIFLFHLLI